MAPVTDLELEILVFIEQLGSTGTIEESRIWKDSSSNLGPQSTYDNLKKKKKQHAKALWSDKHAASCVENLLITCHAIRCLMWLMSTF